MIGGAAVATAPVASLMVAGAPPSPPTTTPEGYTEFAYQRWGTISDQNKRFLIIEDGTGDHDGNRSNKRWRAQQAI